MSTQVVKQECPLYEHNFRFDEETPMEKGVYLILTCEKCGLSAEGLLKYYHAKKGKGLTR